jgi:hypothetical protein
MMVLFGKRFSNNTKLSMSLENFNIILYDAEKPTTEENAQSFFIEKVRYEALLSETTTLLVGTRGRWRVCSKHAYFQSTIICNTHYLILTLQKIDTNETVSYSDSSVQFLKLNPIF